MILNLLRLEGVLSRATLARKIGLTRSTISRIINKLIEDNLVREANLAQGKNGRPGMLLELDPNGGSAVGIEIGVNFITIMLTDFKANKIWRKRITLPDKATSNDYLTKAEELASEALNIAETNHLRKMGIGVGVWGLVDQAKGVIKFAPNLKWRDIPLREEWEKKFRVPFTLKMMQMRLLSVNIISVQGKILKISYI